MQSAPSSPQEAQNDEVHVSIHHKPSCRVELHVKVAPSLIAKAKKNTIKQVSRDVSLPGFRKGKAPEALIVKKFPKEIERNLHKSMADIAFVEAQKIAKIPILNNNSPISFDLKSQTEESAELLFTFETEPTPPSIDPKQFKASPIQRLEVGEKQIEEAIRQMLFFYATWAPVTDRGIQEGDFIMIDLDTLEGETAHQVFHHVRFEVVAERMANWMRNLALNAKAGDVLEGMSEPDATASEQEKQEFQPKKVRLHILKVEQPTLPELNDEFAKKVGAPDIAAMRKSIADILNQKAEEKIQHLLREQINDFLVQTYPFDLPRSLIETEKKHRHNQLLQNPNSRKEWESLSPEERQKREERFSEEAAQAVRLFYLSRQIVRDAKTPITHQEVQDEAVATLNAHGVRRVEIDKIAKEVYALALSKVILRKAQDFILQAQKEA